MNRYYLSKARDFFCRIPNHKWSRTSSIDWVACPASENYLLEDTIRVPSLLITLKGGADA